MRTNPFTNMLFTSFKLIYNCGIAAIGYLAGARSGWGSLCENDNENCLTMIDNAVPIAIIGSYNMLGRYLINSLLDCTPSQHELSVLRQSSSTYILTFFNIIFTSIIGYNLNSEQIEDDKFVKGIIMGFIFTLHDEIGLQVIKWQSNRVARNNTQNLDSYIESNPHDVEDNITSRRLLSYC